MSSPEKETFLENTFMMTKFAKICIESMIPQHQWTVIGMDDIGEVVSRQNDFINGKQ